MHQWKYSPPRRGGVAAAAIKVAKPPKRRRRARSASAIAQSRNSGQTGEMLGPEIFAELTTPAAPFRNGTIFLWLGHPSSARRGMPSTHTLPYLRKAALTERFKLGQDGRKIFRNGWMNMHRALDGGVGRFGIHHVQQNVDYFITASPEDSCTEYLFCFRINCNFDEALSFSLLDRTAHTSHRVLCSQSAAPGFADVGIRHAAAAQRRIDVESVGLDSI